MGDTWTDHKAIVYTVGDENIRTPFAISDHLSNTIHLFYVINDSLMHKTIVSKLFKAEDAYKAWRRPAIYSKDTPEDFGLLHFQDEGRQLRKKESDVVIGNIKSETSWISQQIKIANDIRDLDSSSLPRSTRFVVSGDFKNFAEGFPLTDFIAFFDRQRIISVLYVENGKLFARVSNSDGGGWRDIFEDGVFFHKNINIQEPRFISNLGFSLDDESNMLNLSYIVDEMMFVRSFNAALFSTGQDVIQEKVNPDDDSTRPVFIVGSIPIDVQRAILSETSQIIFPYEIPAMPLFDDTMAVSPIAARGYVGASGLTRMFYQDSNGNLRGLSYSSNKPQLDAKARIK